MTSVLRELPRSHPVEGRRCGAASAEAGTPATAVRGSPTSPTLRVRLHLKPGQKGTKQLLAQYGDRLVCVRDRYDAQRRTRFKTAQIIVAEREWEPPPPPFVPDERVERDWSLPYDPHPAVEACWAQVYAATEKHWEIYDLAEKLVDLDHQFQRWRFEHMKTVERIIGYKRGTGGTSGVAYLVKAMERRLFPELWNVRTGL